MEYEALDEDEDFDDLEDEDDEDAFDEEARASLLINHDRQHANLYDRNPNRMQISLHGAAFRPSVSRLGRRQGPMSTRRSANSSDSGLLP